MRSWIPLLACSCGAVWAQDKPPQEVDQALRSRIRTFYQAHVDGKFRVADQVVAEDSKDAFFEAEKPRYLSFEILGIVYSDNFNKARATVNCEQETAMPGIGRMKVKFPRATLWKRVDGQWFWYVDPDRGRESPFGGMKAGPNASGPPSPIPPGVSLDDLSKMVEADRNAVQLHAGATERVTISNRMPGGVKLVVHAPEIPGFAATLDRDALAQNQAAVLTLRYDPKAGAKPPAASAVFVDVEPINQRIGVRLRFAPPAEK